MNAQYMEKLNSPTGTVYLVVSDLHKSYKNLANRIDYSSEIEFVENKIISLSSEYRSLGYNTNLIFMGDIFHSSFRSVSAALKTNTEFRKFSKHFKKVFSVIGNHELTYYNNNPFWYLINNFKTKRIKDLRETKVGTGVIDIYDRIIDGEVEIIFNHYNAGIYPATPDMYSIGLFHQDIMFSQVVDDASSKGRNVFKTSEFLDMETYNKLDSYNYCMFGHNHMLYGKWEDTDRNLVIHNIASLGRTNHKEVDNNFLERVIPAIIIEDGKLANIELNKFDLPSRELCVNEEEVSLSQDKYKLTKERKEIREYDCMNDNPVSSLKLAFNNAAIDNIIDSFIKHEYDNFFTSIKED